MECNTFDVLRQQLFIEMMGIDNVFNQLDDNEKFIFILSKPEAGKLAGEYLNKTFQIRTCLAENHKRNGSAFTLSDSVTFLSFFFCVILVC